MRFSFCAIDTETNLIPPSGKVRTSPVSTHVVCTSISAAPYAGTGSTRNHVLAWNERGAADVIEQYIRSSDFIVMHNATYDVGVLSRGYPSLRPHFEDMLREGRLLDTRVMFALRYPGYKGRYSLANLVRELFNVELEKGAVRTSFRREKPMDDEQIAYALQDAVWTRRSAERLVNIPYGGMAKQPAYFVQHQIFSEQTQEDLVPDQIFSESSAWLAYNIEAVGLQVDKKRLQDYFGSTTDVVEDRLKALHRHCLAKPSRDRAVDVETVRLNVDEILPEVTRKWGYHAGWDCMLRLHKGVLQRGAVKWSLDETALRASYQAASDVIGVVPPTSEKTGKLSLEYDFWKEHYDRLPEGLKTHLDLGKQRKLLSTYFKPMMAASEGKDRLIVHPHIGVAFADTGRWTCWRPNLQNQPKSVRDMYRSPIEGDVLVSADYKSLEMYTAVEAMHQLGIQNGPLRQVLDEGGDTHLNTARVMFEEDMSKDDPRRKVAKVCNFALLGGMGPPKFMKTARAAGLEWDLQTARDMRERWFNTFHDCASFLELFRIEPWELRPQAYHKKGWLELNSIPTDPWPSKFELSRALNDGALYCVRLPDGRVVPNRRYSQAANIFFQGLGADVVSLAFNRVCRLGLPVCIVVHDSITISSPPEFADEFGANLVDEMRMAQEEIITCGVKIPTPEFEKGEFWS